MSMQYYVRVELCQYDTDENIDEGCLEAAESRWYDKTTARALFERAKQAGEVGEGQR